MDQPCLPTVTPITLDSPLQSLPLGGSHAQPDNPRQHADEPFDASPEHLHSMLECTSPVKLPLPSMGLEAGPQSASNGSAIASPTLPRRRAAKSLRMTDPTPLAAAAAAESALLESASSAMQNLPMMTVPDRPKAPKLSPPKGITASPQTLTKPAGIRWPPDAAALHEQAAPFMTSPGRPAPYLEAFRVSAACPGNQYEAPVMTAGGDVHSRPVAYLQSPLTHSMQTLPTGSSIIEFAHANNLGVAATEEDAKHLVYQISGGQLTDDQFDHPANRASDLFAMRSAQSMQVAEASGTQYASQLRQRNLPQHLEGQMADENAIDLCSDEAVLEPAMPADSLERQAQIQRDEQLAREIDMHDTTGTWQLNVSALRPHLHLIGTLLSMCAKHLLSRLLGTAQLHCCCCCLSVASDALLHALAQCTKQICQPLTYLQHPGSVAAGA